MRQLQRGLVIAMCVSVLASGAQTPATDDPVSDATPAGLVSARSLSRFSVLLENDVLLFGADNEDRNYTMGFALESSGPWIARLGLDKPRRWADRLLHTDRVHKRLRDPSPAATAATAATAGTVMPDAVQFGLSAFTPDELRDPDPQPNDRPYASILYLISRQQSVNGPQDRAFTTELSLAVLGLNLADWFQTTLHDGMQDDPNDTPYLPQGWHLQVSDGGEPTARYAMKWQRLLGCGERYDLQWTGEAHAGYYTNAALGGALRVGRIRSPWWAFSPAPIEEAQMYSMDDTRGAAIQGCGAQTPGTSELYAWAGATGRAWGYNVLLQGQFRDAPSTIRSGNIERLVGEYQLGVTGSFTVGRSVHSLTYAYARRSPEFDGPERRYHSWAGLYYAISFDAAL